MCAELDGNGFFLEFTSCGNFLANKTFKKMPKRLDILAGFFGQRWAIEEQNINEIDGGFNDYRKEILDKIGDKVLTQDLLPKGY